MPPRTFSLPVQSTGDTELGSLTEDKKTARFLLNLSCSAGLHLTTPNVVRVPVSGGSVGSVDGGITGGVGVGEAGGAIRNKSSHPNKKKPIDNKKI